MHDIGGTKLRRLTFALAAPGFDLPVEVTTTFREDYHRVRDGWQLAEYTYEYLDRRQGVRLAYHLHDLLPARAVFHAHCGAPPESGPGEDAGHLRATEVGLLEAHDEFMRLYASEGKPDCGRFRLLGVGS